MRQVAVYVSKLPPGSAVWAAVHGLPVGWTLTDLLLADVFHALTGQEHPDRPRRTAAAAATPADLIARLRAQRERLAATTP